MTARQAVFDAWREVLGQQDVDPDVPFLEAGGDSLKAIQLASRLSEALGVDVPLMAAFDHPTPRELAATLAGAAAARPGPPAAEETALSLPQSRLWFLSQLDPASAAYHAPAAWWLAGPLDRGALGRAVVRLVERHEALRTSFPLVGDEPVQRVAPTAAGFALETIEPPAPGRAAALRLAGELAARPFALAGDRLARPWLIPVTDGEHLLVIGLHHAVCDGPSRAILGRDLLALYGGELPPLPLRYADFASRQRRAAGDGVEQRRQELAGMSDALPVVPDHPRPARPSGRGGRHPVEIRGDLVRRLRGLCAERGVTPFMALLASFVAVLHRWGGQEDVAIGVPVLGRPLPDFRDVVGHFANTIVLRLRPSAGLTFDALLRHVREVALAAYAHQDLPFELLVRELAPDRDLSRNPLFQVLFALQPAPPVLAGAGLRMEPVELDLGTAKVDLTAWLEAGQDRIAGHLEYRSDLFEPATVARLADHWGRLLRAAVARPDAPVGDIELLSTADRRALAAWNRTAPVRRPACIHQLFEAQVERSPDATALVAGASQLTYRQLDAWADRIAARLRDAGAAPDTVVAVCLSRGAGLVAALLGVLKSGAAYLPLDPAHPPEHRRLVLGMVPVAVAVTEPRLAAAVRGPGRRVVLLGEPPAAGGEPRRRAAVHPGGLAYVIPTSGSTGRPKGVAIEHRSVTALVDWARGAYGPEELSGVLASTSVCFDLSAFELFVPLATGGTVVLCENVLGLPALPGRERVRLVNTVPSAAAALLGLGPLPASVTTVNLAGEPLPGSLVQDLYRQPGVRRVLNLYGPSEDTTYSTWEVVPRTPGTPAIGRPVAGSRAYLLDGRLRPVAPGMTGAIHLSGAGLARGYAGRPGLTAGSFLPDPFRGDGSRMYATGDTGRRLADGRLQYLGRTDAQAKVRGVRVEPGEVESALLAVAGVREAAVVAVGDGVERALVACVVGPGAGGPLELAERLRGELSARLPTALVPSAFVELDRFPRTPSGKVDRRQLAELAAARRAAPAAGPSGQVAGDDVERAVAATWCDVLGVPTLPEGRTFFELGGHSLLAARMVARLRERLGVDVGLASVFESPTVAGVARAVRAARTAAPAIPSGRPAAPARLSFAQRRLYFLEMLGLGAPCYNLGALIHVHGPLDPDALRGALGRVVDRHDALRTSFRAAGPGGEPVQLAEPGPGPACPLTDLSGLPAAEAESEARRLAVAQAAARFDLARGPLLRCRLLRMGPSEHRLAVAVHHLVFDGWSGGVLTRELAAAYAGAPAPAPLPLRFADFAEWQRSDRYAERMAPALAAARTALAGAPAALALPTDRPRPPFPSSRGARVPVVLPAKASARVRELAAASGATSFMVVLATFARVLGRRAGQRRVVVGCPVATRTQPELAGLIGFLVDTLAIPIDLSGEPPMPELVARARRACLDAFRRQELPFEQLVEALDPPRDLARNPVFQAAFAMQSEPFPSVADGERRWELEWLDLGTSKFDLLLDLKEASGAIAGHLEYSTDLWEEGTIAGLADELLDHLGG